MALLVDFANLRQQIDSLEDAGARAGGDAGGEDAPEAAAEASAGAGAEASPAGADTAQIARSLVRFAGTIGRVGLARAYADWSREPQLARRLNGTRLSPVLVPATEDGEDRSHIRLTVDAMETLFNGDEPEAFVIVSSDPSLVPLVQAIRADGSEVVLVAADEDTAEELRAESDQFASFEHVLGGGSGRPVEPRGYTERGAGGEGARGRAAGGNGAGGRGAGGSERGRGKSGGRADAARDRGYYSSKPLLTESNFEDYDWTGFIALIDELEQRLPFVGVRYLVNKVLGPHNCGIEDPHIKRDLINEAVDDGLIEMYSVGNVNDRTDPVTACRLDRRNPLVVEALGPDLTEEDAEAQDALVPEDAAGEYSATAP